MSVIAIVGSLNMDLVIRAPRQPLLGETLMGHSFGTTGGGKGSNQALACARLGAESYMVGCVGNDDFGARLRATLLEGKVDCSRLEVSKESRTGVAFITVTDDGDNTIVLASGANALVDEKTIENALDIFKKADSVMFQLEIPLPAVEAGLATARKSGCRTALTPAPVRPLPDTIWPMVDYLVLNETELAYYSASGDRTGGEDYTVEAAERLLKLGAKCIVATCGAKGGVVVTKEKVFSYPPFKVEAMDSTGAGDSFCAATIVGLSEGMSLEQAVCFASAAGALACTRFGAHPSIPWRHEVEALLERSGETTCRKIERTEK
ncbi:MAG: ribokinase [Synergistaceae bacterium]|nr:ribokinase [Synergistaceae bacterium]